MLEAPEARLTARQLNETITGKRITVVMAAHTPHKFTFYHGDPALYEELLLGKTVGKSHSYGGMVETEIEDTRLLFSDGANIRFFGSEAKLPAKHQLLIGFEDNSCLVVSVRMYGAVFCYPAGGYDSNLKDYFESARTKPQVMSDDFTEEYFLGLLGAESAQKKSAKAALATEQVIPGLGNGVLQDILYNTRIHPKTKIKDVDRSKQQELYKILRETLLEMEAKGGRNTESDIFGIRGRYIPWLSKDTEGEKCMRCGQMILKENYLGGSIYYCPGCQKK